MEKALVTPSWQKDPGSAVRYVDRHFTDFDQEAWGGTTVRGLWDTAKNYLSYLREQRAGELNEPEAYELLEQNIDRLLAGQPLVWAVDRFGYQKARELIDKRFIPRRDRFFVADDGSRIPTTDHEGKVLGYFGGVTDGTYISLGEHLGAIIHATFHISEPEVMVGGRSLSVEEKVKLYSRDGEHFKVVEREAAK